MPKMTGRSAFVLRTINGGQFLAELGQERRNGTISPDTEQRVRAGVSHAWPGRAGCRAGCCGWRGDRPCEARRRGSQKTPLRVIRRKIAGQPARRTPNRRRDPPAMEPVTVRQGRGALFGVNSGRGLHQAAERSDLCVAVRQSRTNWPPCRYPAPSRGLHQQRASKPAKQGPSPQTRRLEGAEGLCPFSPPNRSSAQLPPPAPSGSGSVQPGPREACFPPPSPPLTRLREAADAASQQLRKGIPAWPDLPKTHDFEPP